MEVEHRVMGLQERSMERVNGIIKDVADRTLKKTCRRCIGEQTERRTQWMTDEIRSAIKKEES